MRDGVGRGSLLDSMAFFVSVVDLVAVVVLVIDAYFSVVLVPSWDVVCVMDVVFSKDGVTNCLVVVPAICVLSIASFCTGG